MKTDDRRKRLEEIAHELSDLTHKFAEAEDSEAELAAARQMRDLVREAWSKGDMVRNAEAFLRVLALKEMARQTPGDTREIMRELEAIQGEIMEAAGQGGPPREPEAA